MTNALATGRCTLECAVEQSCLQAIGGIRRQRGLRLAYPARAAVAAGGYVNSRALRYLSQTTGLQKRMQAKQL